MKIKTSELTGPALRWAVAWLESKATPPGLEPPEVLLYRSTATNAYSYKRWAINYDTDWSQGGPIIEREGINLLHEHEGWHARFGRMRLTFDGRAKHYHHEFGPTPLIAAMRCYVASRLGDEVDVPEELT